MKDNYCPRYDKCYFPKEIANENLTKKDMIFYLSNCVYGGVDCELSKVSNIEFKIIQREKEFKRK